MAYLRNIVCRGSKTTQFGWRQFSRALAFSEEVQDAKVSGKPLVALESTIITHGMPYPQNLETALAVENIIREKVITPRPSRNLNLIFEFGIHLFCSYLSSKRVQKNAFCI